MKPLSQGGGGSAVIDRNLFVATSIIVSKCDCGCGNTKLLLLDKHERVRATATAIPDDLIRRATEAKADAPMTIERLN